MSSNLSSIDETTEMPKEIDDDILFSCGMIADVQYGDADDGFNYTKTRRRRFRSALQIVKNGIKIWNDTSNKDKNKNKNTASLIISLGDIIDILNSKTQPKQSQLAMKTALSVFNTFKPSDNKKETLLKYIEQGSKIYDSGNNSTDEIKDDQTDKIKINDHIAKYPLFHNLIGNHELYNFNRKELLKYMKGEQVDNDIKFYYSFTPSQGYVFIMLDAYDIGYLGYEYCDNKHDHYKQAEALLNKNNPNKDKHVPVPTYGFDRRFRAFNGAFGVKQLKWLESQLIIAQNRKDNVILFSHVPIYTHSNKDYDILQWDYKEMIAIIDKYSCVKMYFAGHDHIGDLYKDKNGVYFVTFAGAIESVEDTNCFATAHFFKNRMEMEGYGMIKSNKFIYREF